MAELLYIPIKDIYPNEVALRSVDEESVGFMEMVESVRIKGILNPINVMVRAEGGYTLVDGLHRYTAAKTAGLDVMPAQVITIEDNIDLLVSQVIGNVQKIDTKPVHFAHQIKRIISAKPTATQDEIARLVGKSSQWVAQRLSLLKLCPEIQSLVDEGKIVLANALQLACLPAEEQLAFLERAQIMQAAEFVPLARDRAKEISTQNRKGVNAGDEQFVPVPHMRKGAELKTVLENSEIITGIIDRLGITSPHEAALVGFKYTMGLDPESVAAAQAKWEAEKKAREENKNRMDAERLRKKEEAAKKAVEEATAARMAIEANAPVAEEVV